jgi:hypothetical protein
MIGELIVHECPRDNSQWRTIEWSSQLSAWAIEDGEYSSSRIICCPYCGIRLDNPDPTLGVSTEGAAWAAESGRAE